MSGIYDIRPWTGGYDDELVLQGNPCQYIGGINDEKQLEAIRRLDMIIAIGRDDPAFVGNETFSRSLWNRGVWHAFRVWDGWAHDWPYWQEMIRHYIGGPDSKG